MSLCRRTHHVTLGGVDAIGQAFDSDPFDGHLGDPALPVVVSVVDLLGEAEVGHAHVHVLVQPEEEKPECFWRRGIQAVVESKIRTFIQVLQNL